MSENIESSQQIPSDQHVENGEPSPKRMKLENESQPEESELDREIDSYNMQLYDALNTNVELHNEQIKAENLLRKLTSQNQDLLEALMATEPDLLNVKLVPAPLVNLTPDQERDFDLQTSW